jgi:ubiquinone/menaquinone biosynthesis C-methylase UbiE
MDRLLELTSQAEASHFWFRGFRQFVSPLVQRALAGRSGLTLLDCGCGTGHNLRTLLAPHGAAYGMDLTAAGLQIARRTGRPLTRADATRIPFKSATFDVVTSFDMLQCVTDDGAAVAEIVRVLKPGGYFAGTVAALNVLHGDHSVLSEEVRRYTRGGLVSLLQAKGLEPLVARYAFASLFPLLLGVRIVQRARGAHAAGREITVPPAPVNAALSVLVSGEAAIARAVPMPFGSSVVFLAQKRTRPPK